MILDTEYYWIEKTLELAQKALPEDVPIGALIINSENNLISEAFNEREKNKKISSHAEILALDRACQKLNTWRLSEYTLYISLEPCLMCAGAIIQSRIKKVIFGAFENKSGASSELFKAGIQVIGGIKEEKCLKILQNFFKTKRNISI